MRAMHYHKQRNGRGRLNKSGYVRAENAPSVTVARYRVTDGERTLYCMSIREARVEAARMGGAVWDDQTGKEKES